MKVQWQRSIPFAISLSCYLQRDNLLRDFLVAKRDNQKYYQRALISTLAPEDAIRWT